MPLRSWSGLLPSLPQQERRPSGAGIGLRLAVMLLPAVLLLLGTLRTDVTGNPQMLLFLGTGFQILLCCYGARNLRGWSQPIGPTILLLYLTGLGWLWIGRSVSDLDDWYLHFAQALLLIVSLIVFAFQVLVDSGAPEWRRAQLLASRLAERTDWPAELASCRLLPEVKALRDSLHIDATPGLALLAHPRPQVRIAALAALEFRKQWRPGQAEMVLQFARHAPEPAIRAAAISALANVDDRILIEQVADFLRDPSAEVRRAASEALLWDTNNRWAWIRMAVRRALTDSHYTDETNLLPAGQSLPPDAVKDFTAWAAEKGFLAVRAALTLGAHYGRALTEQADPELPAELQALTANTDAPPALRIELARLLRDHDLLPPALQEKLLDPINPAPLRLIAADILLESGEHPGAASALRDVARLPNREIALATASIVQQRLGVDLGLPVGQSAPPVHSRQAAEVTRRVMSWAAEANQPLELPEALHR
jgi:hypothetical protein